MQFTSYKLISTHTSSLNFGSYLNSTEYSLFVNGTSPDFWYGMSKNDVIELGVWDRRNNFIGWNILPHKSEPEFTIYKNNKILLSPTEELSSSFGILDGSYFLTYNFTRNMAGDITDPLLIKDISPSRRELKLIPTKNSPIYEAFCNSKIVLGDASPIYLKLTAQCPYEKIYNNISTLYANQINTIKSLFFLNNDGNIITFLKNLYEDLIIYTNISTTNIGDSNNGQIIKLQGINTYFNNYLISNSQSVVSFTDIDSTFNGFVSASVERKFKPIGNNLSKEYIDAKLFVYDFFTKYFYHPITDKLSQTYKEKYFNELKNALNFGNNKLLSILKHGFVDERESVNDPLTLLIKLQYELPSDIALQESCWISNISLIPYIVSAIFKNDINKLTYKIGSPDFSIPFLNTGIGNSNKKYTSDDLASNHLVSNDFLTQEKDISKKLQELNINYEKFENFVVFSSAEVRLNIFKNKIITLSNLKSSLQILNSKNINFLSASGSLYPFYTAESEDFQASINNIITSFDGYESHLYRGGNYTYVNSAFASESFISDLNNSARYYDKNNRDSLINNCPDHILSDENNDEYIVFLSMIGHFFDEIYVYISNMPSEKTITNNKSDNFTRRIVDYMLQTFGWTLDDTIEQSNIINNYLTSDQVSGLNIMSSEDRLKEIRNRILNNLPHIYKTKGTEESVRSILSCYGIPSSLLNIREFGGIGYNESATYTTYERSYMYQWNTSSIHDYFRTNILSDCKTFLFKVSIDDSTSYVKNKEQILIGVVNSGSLASSPFGSGEWAIGFVRDSGTNTGKIFFRIGHNDDVKFKMYSPTFPLFDGSIYSIMLRRNIPSNSFEFTTNTDAIPSVFDLYVQKNEFGRRDLYLTSSNISYNNSTNLKFSTPSNPSYLIIGGWFADHNGQGFDGAMDKLQVWYDPIDDSNFEDYVNSINSYSFNGNRISHQSLVFRMHTDYPINIKDTKTWKNGNPFYATSSSLKQKKYLNPTYTASMDALVNVGAWSGSQKLVYDSASCGYVSQSCYPYQFKIVDYPSTWGISKYGPNKFHNEKTKYTTQTTVARLDNNESSAYTTNKQPPDSNQVGFFADPQDFRNKDIVRYFGNFDFMNVIGDPNNQYNSGYSVLHDLRNQYVSSLNEFSGSKILFNELITLYKLYFNKSIFETIKNVIPARANVLSGILIEPTILERPKYAIKPIVGELNSGSISYNDVTLVRYIGDTNTSLQRMTQDIQYGDFNIDKELVSNFNISTLPNNLITDVNLSYINLPTRNHTINYLPSGNYIPDVLDDYQLGHVAGGIIDLPHIPILIPPEVLSVDFAANLTSGVSPLVVTFANLSKNAYLYVWDFGDGTTSNEENPTHTYYVGVYTVTLTATAETQDILTKTAYINVMPSHPCLNSYKISGSVARFPTIYNVNFGDSIGIVNLKYNLEDVPDKIVITWGGQTVIDTGYRGQSNYQSQLDHLLTEKGLPKEKIKGVGLGIASFNKNTADPNITIKVYSPMTSKWNFILECPI